MTADQDDGIRTWELIRRLIAEGPDRIAYHAYRRVTADRIPAGTSLPTEALSWPEIAEWAQQEGLLDAEQARLLRRAARLAPAGDDVSDRESPSRIGERVKGPVPARDTGSKEPPNPLEDTEPERGAS